MRHLRVLRGRVADGGDGSAAHLVVRVLQPLHHRAQQLRERTPL
jgi:hypothetical protein